MLSGIAYTMESASVLEVCGEISSKTSSLVYVSTRILVKSASSFSDSHSLTSVNGGAVLTAVHGVTFKSFSCFPYKPFGSSTMLSMFRKSTMYRPFGKSRDRTGENLHKTLN